jgi:hypothetical protein
VTTFAVVAGGAGANLDETVETILAGANLIADGFSMAASNFLGSRPQPSSRAGGAAFAARGERAGRATGQLTRPQRLAQDGSRAPAGRM